MADFKAKVRPELHPAAQELVRVYESVPGSTGPGCCPEALAAVLQYVASCAADDMEPAGCVSGFAALLRGEQP
jgi:hypothetical protein